LPIHARVIAFWQAVNATLEHSKLRQDREASEQISRANDSIPSNLVEGFEQTTDKSFANFVGYAKGSLAEVLKRLKKAHYRGLVTADELNTLLEAGEELGKMLGGFIKYLRKSDFKDRGSHSVEEKRRKRRLKAQEKGT